MLAAPGALDWDPQPGDSINEIQIVRERDPFPAGADGLQVRARQAAGPGPWVEYAASAATDFLIDTGVDGVLFDIEARWTLAGAPVSDWSAIQQQTSQV